MSRYDWRDPYNERRSSNIFRHAGFQVGAMGGVILGIIHWALLLTINVDWLAWVVHPFMYFMLARAAAEQHHRAQQDLVDHLRGVQGAGVGAALVTSIVTWVFVVMFFIFGDTLGANVVISPINMYCGVVIDVLIALALGAWGGSRVVRKHQGYSGQW